jgi:hypothetical protein
MATRIPRPLAMNRRQLLATVAAIPMSGIVPPQVAADAVPVLTGSHLDIWTVIYTTHVFWWGSQRHCGSRPPQPTIRSAKERRRAREANAERAHAEHQHDHV